MSRPQLYNRIHDGSLKSQRDGAQTYPTRAAWGILPAIVQQADSGVVLMLGYMNRSALEAPLTRRRVAFFVHRQGSLVGERGDAPADASQFHKITFAPESN